MIFNRKYADIINARSLFINKIQKFQTLTTAEQQIIDKAYFNLNAVNRISSKIQDIWSMIIILGGEKPQNIDVRQWGEQEIFVVSDFNNFRLNIVNILDEIQSLNFFDENDLNSLYVSYNALNNEYTLSNLNNLEKLLYDIFNLFSIFAIQVEDILYIFGAYNASLTGGELSVQ